MEEELIELGRDAMTLVGYIAIIYIFNVIAKYFAPIVDYYKDIKIAKMTGKKKEDMETVIVQMVTPTKAKAKSYIESIKEKRRLKKERKKYGLEATQVY